MRELEGVGSDPKYLSGGLAQAKERTGGSTLWRSFEFEVYQLPYFRNKKNARVCGWLYLRSCFRTRGGYVAAIRHRRRLADRLFLLSGPLRVNHHRAIGRAMFRFSVARLGANTTRGNGH